MFVEEACLKCISKYLNQVSEFKYLNWIIDFNSELDYNPKVKYKRWLTGGWQVVGRSEATGSLYELYKQASLLDIHSSYTNHEHLQRWMHT
jgi:hypothetical protein